MENITNKPREIFSNLVKNIMKSKGKSQADLTRLCSLNKSIVNRIYHDSNNRGSTYTPNIYTVMAISIGLKLNTQESKDLLFSAFPEMEYWKCFLDKHLDIDRANDILYDAGLKTFGSSFKE